MFLGIITLLTALSMATVAAVFAIYGIMAIFSGMPEFALVMGIVIELGKVVGISWLYRNWTSPTKIKWAMTPIVIVSMALTSMGIFGLLSKAHLEQTSPVANNQIIIERLDQQITRERSKIDDAVQVISQLDQSVQVLINFDRIRGPDGALAVRESQSEQRELLRQTIDESQLVLDGLEDQKLELSQQLRAIELEVGPVKYLAEMVYGTETDRTEEAVRWVIIAFIFVFDPMAILLLMAANYTLANRKPLVAPVIAPETNSTQSDDTPKLQDDSPIEHKELETVPTSITTNDNDNDNDLYYSDEVEVIEPVSNISQETDSYIPVDVTEEPEYIINEDNQVEVVDDIVIDIQDEDVPEPLDEQVDGTGEVFEESPVTSPIQPEELKIVFDEAEFKENSRKKRKEKITTTLHDVGDGYIQLENKLYQSNALKEMRPELFPEYEPSTSYGATFPPIAKKNTIFTRIDMIPHQTFRFTGINWTKVENPIFPHNYLQYLIKQLESNQYDVESLNDHEKTQLELYLKTIDNKDK